jgi:hypothetical protein
MIEGFWIVQYEGMKGNGGGVAVFIRGQIFGGDTGYTYLGSYQTQGNLVKARVKVQNFLPDVPNVLGVVGDFDLNIEGTVTGDVFRATGSLPQEEQAVGIALKLTKRAEVPI